MEIRQARAGCDERSARVYISKYYRVVHIGDDYIYSVNIGRI